MAKQSIAMQRCLSSNSSELIKRLSKDLTKKYGKGFSRSNLFQIRLFYLKFPKIQTVSGQLTWSHYFEILKADDELEKLLEEDSHE
jgi:hypothetical protein